jgi:hypothetical protein
MRIDNAVMAFRCLILASMLLWRSTVGALAGPAVIERIELSGGAAATDVTILADAPLDVEIFALADPDRLVLDLGETEWRLRPPASVGLVSGVRYGLAAPGRGRIVLDLAAPAGVTAQVRRDGGRVLILTLGPESRATFDAAAGWPARAGPVAAVGGGARRLRIALDPGHGGSTAAPSVRASSRNGSCWTSRCVWSAVLSRRGSM